MTMAEKASGMGGSALTPEVAPKGKRVAAAIIDLIIIPILLGIIVGVLLLAAPDGVRNTLLILVNIAWMIFRDAVISPGRKMVGTKIISLEGTGKVSVGQAFIRNILLIIPFVLVVGYIVEIIFLLSKGERLADGWAKTRVVNA